MNTDDDALTAVNTAVIQRGKPFQPGQSGNPSGKPKGALNKTTRASLALLEAETEAITRKAVELALEGDTTALRLCMERIAPAFKPCTAPALLDIPPPNNLTDTARAFLSAAARGVLAPDVAAQLVSSIASVARVEEVENLKLRLETLERAVREQKPCK